MPRQSEEQKTPSPGTPSYASAESPRRQSKKDQILSLYTSGFRGLQEIAHVTGASTSYVASVLRHAGKLTGYFDLYTETAEPMNVYSKYFEGRLSFKNEVAASETVALLDRTYREFNLNRDRAGQHHVLTVALTMFDRARWCGKLKESELFRRWLVGRLMEYPRALETH